MLSRPLKLQWFQILLALSAQKLHGYGIQRAVLDQTDGQMRLWPAMLYRSLSTLEAEGVIRPVDQPDHEPDDERRQYYAITDKGRRLLRDEARMLERWVSAAKGSGR